MEIMELTDEKVTTFLEKEVQNGQAVTVAMFQRTFRVGYKTAKLSLERLVESGHLEIREDRIVPYYRKCETPDIINK